ncbi:MAG: glutamine amidotransferase [Clostridiales bacterium]|nr:glutamine amidotransferase [Clostridiales bacterium]
MAEIELRICHMYPDLLNLYGDRGNVLSLIRRAELRGISVKLVPVSIGDEFDEKEFDIVFLGGGQDAEQNVIRKDFVDVKGPKVKEAIENGMVFLCICGGYQMLGHYYQEHDGTKIECLGAIDIYTVGEDIRYIQDTTYEADFLRKSTAGASDPAKDPGILYGFENHSGRTYLGPSVKPMAKVLEGAGNNGKDGYEGAIYNNVYCTYSHGSFLPKNPAMTDHLLSLALKRRYGEDYELPELSMENEEFARAALLRYKEKGNTAP